MELQRLAGVMKHVSKGTILITEITRFLNGFYVFRFMLTNLSMIDDLNGLILDVFVDDKSYRVALKG